MHALRDVCTHLRIIRVRRRGWSGLVTSEDTPCTRDTSPRSGAPGLESWLPLTCWEHLELLTLNPGSSLVGQSSEHDPSASVSRKPQKQLRSVPGTQLRPRDCGGMK